MILTFFSPEGQRSEEKVFTPLIYVASTGQWQAGVQETCCESCFIIQLLLSTCFLSNGRKMSLRLLCCPSHGIWSLLLWVERFGLSWLVIYNALEIYEDGASTCQKNKKPWWDWLEFPIRQVLLPLPLFSRSPTHLILWLPHILLLRCQQFHRPWDTNIDWNICLLVLHVLV